MADKTTPQPTVPRRLVEWLEESYPERVPEPLDNVAEIMHYAGRRALVKELRAIYERQVDKESARADEIHVTRV